MKKAFLTGILLLSPIAASHAQNTWTQKTNVGGSPRFGAVGFSVNGKGYIGTGATNANATALASDFWEYDPNTNSWTQKADFGGGTRFDAVGFSIGNKGYIGTGWAPGLRNDFWEYDPSSNSWTQKASFPASPRQAASRFDIDNKGYVGTGFDGSNDNDFYEYDPNTDTWTQKANFAGSARNGATGFSIAGKGYLGIGFDNNGTTNDFWEYDPATDSWTQKANFAGLARIGAGAFSVGTKGYIGPGSLSRDVTSNTNEVWEYDPTGNMWTQKANYGGGARGGIARAAFAIGGKGYIGTGYDNSVVLQADFWEYDPLLNTIGTGALTGGPYCPGVNIDISFTTIGTANAGNIFTAQLSDALGSFTSPVDIGSLAGTTSGTISATIPSDTIDGTAYRIRVVSSDPVVIGSDNGSALTVMNCAPVVTNYVPPKAAVGRTIIISGSQFTGTTGVTFAKAGGGTIDATTFTVVSDTSLTAKVPSLATTGAINVTNSFGTGSGPVFKVVPKIRRFTPTSGPVGTNVTITGNSFTGATKVQVNVTNAASFTVVSDTTITAVLGAGSTTGKISVQTSGGRARSKTNFTVTP